MQVFAAPPAPTVPVFSSSVSGVAAGVTLTRVPSAAFGWSLPLKPFCATSATRLSVTLGLLLTNAAMLDVAASVPAAAVKVMSSTVIAVATPAIASAKPGSVGVTFTVFVASYVHAPHAKPPYTLTADVSFTCSA